MGFMNSLKERAFERTLVKKPTQLPDDYQQLEHDFQLHVKSLEAVMRVSKDTFAIGARNGAASNLTFGQALVLCGAQFSEDSNLSYTLVKVGELQERLAVNQHTFESLSRNNYIAYWNRFLEVDVSAAQRAIDKVHQRRLEYDNYLGRRQYDLETPYYVNEHYLEAGRRLQLAMDTAKELMLKAMQGDEYQRQILHQFLDAEYEYYNACALEIYQTRARLLDGPANWAEAGEQKPEITPDHKHLLGHANGPAVKSGVKKVKKFVPPPEPAVPSSALFHPVMTNDMNDFMLHPDCQTVYATNTRKPFHQIPVEQVERGMLVGNIPLTGVQPIHHQMASDSTNLSPEPDMHYGPTTGESIQSQAPWNRYPPGPDFYHINLTMPPKPVKLANLQPDQYNNNTAYMTTREMSQPHAADSHGLALPTGSFADLQKGTTTERDRMSDQSSVSTSSSIFNKNSIPVHIINTPSEMLPSPVLMSAASLMDDVPPAPPLPYASSASSQQQPLQEQQPQQHPQQQQKVKDKLLSKTIMSPEPEDMAHFAQQSGGLFPSGTPPVISTSDMAGPGQGTYSTLFDFNSEDPVCLPIKKGDQINVIKKYPQGWWYGEANGKKGFFPEGFVSLTKK